MAVPRYDSAVSFIFNRTMDKISSGDQKKLKNSTASKVSEFSNKNRVINGLTPFITTGTGETYLSIKRYAKEV
jgi:hypothetical protein